MENLEYKSYLKEKSENEHAVSDAEHEARHAIDNMGIKTDFVLLHITDCLLSTYRCLVKGDGRFRIDKIETWPHHIGELIDAKDDQGKKQTAWNAMYYLNGHRYTYDDYYDRYLPDGFNERLVEALSPLSREPELPVLVRGLFCDWNAVLYALQGKYREVLLMPIPEKDLYRHLYINPDILKTEHIHVSVNGMSLSDCLKGSAPIIVPLCPESLDTTFWRNITWRDVVPATDVKDGDLAGLPVKHITLRADVDGYQNVFLTTDDYWGNSRRILISQAIETE